MQTITAQLDQAFRKAIQEAFGLEADPLIGPSQNEKFGDYQSNAAMGLAKAVAEKTGQKANPRQVAEQIKAKLDLGEMVEEISIAGPGFINVRLSPKWLAKQLQGIESDARLGIEPAHNPQRVIVDYPSPNAAKEMHIGHLRPMDIGDAIARVLDFQGDEVIPQNHIGDWGTQFGMLLAYVTETQPQGAPIHIENLDEFYKAARQKFDSDPAFAEKAKATVVRLQRGEPHELALWKQIMAESRRHADEIYRRMGIKVTQEHERGESFYNLLLSETVTELQKLGVAQPSEGAIAVFVEGFEAPLIIQKSGGGYLYGTTDLAAVRFRTRDLKATRIVYVTDSRQAQHFTQFFSAAKKAGWISGVELNHVMFGTILGEDGKPFKARSGESVRLKDVLDEAEERALKIVTEKNPDLPESERARVAKAVGIGAVKYFDLARDRTSDYVFDWSKMLAMEGNTAPYLQYAYARIRSIFRKAGEEPSSAPIALESTYELSIAKHVLRLGDVIHQVARDLKPHLLCNYLYDLATKFSAFYENCPVLKSEGPVRASRLALCHLTSTALALGLDLLGIEHPEQM
jgi:arginyl-tRNA synthetase